LDETANVTPSNVGAYHHQTLAILTADLIRAQHEFQRGNLSQRDKVDSVVGSTRYRWHRNRQASQHIRIGTQRIGKTNNDVETTVTLKKGSGFPSANRGGDGILHIADVEPEACRLVTIHIDAQQWEARRLLHFNFGSAWYVLQYRRDVISCFVENIHVVPEHLNGHIAANSGN